MFEWNWKGGLQGLLALAMAVAFIGLCRSCALGEW